jgi:hypothetical protein
MSRTRQLLRVLVVLGVGTLAAAAHAEWQIRPDFNLEFLRGRFEPWFAPEDSGRDWRGEIDFVADGLFTRRYDDGWFVQLGAGVGSFEGWHRGTTGAEPEQTSVRFSVDGDLPFGKTPEKRFTLGLLVGTRSNEVGGINVDSGTHYTTAFTYTWKASGRCELRTVTGYYDVENVDDKVNAGDPSFDRGGSYRAAGAEVSLLLGDTAFPCERLGPFRQLDSYGNVSFHLGARFATDSTDGSELVADRVLGYGRGWVPLWPAGRDREPRRPAPDVVEWRFEIGRAEFSDVAGRVDDGVLLEAAVRWGFVRAGKWPHWVKNFDLSAGVAWERRSSTVERFEFDDFGFFAGLWMRFSRDVGAGPGTQGGALVRRRPSPGRSAPKVPAELARGPG